MDNDNNESLKEFENKQLVFTKKIVIAFVIIATISALCGALLVSCSGKSIKDMGDNTVAVEKEVTNIACLWPSFTNSMIALGMGDKISAVSAVNDEYINAWAQKICPKCKEYKNFKSTTPSVDELKAGNYDLVILHPETLDTQYKKELLDAGIKAVDLHYNSYEEMQTVLKRLSDMVDEGSKNTINKYCELLKSKFERSKEFKENPKLMNPTPVAYLPGHDMDPQMVYPQNSVVKEWINYSSAVDVMEQYEVGDVTTVPISDLRQANQIFIGGPYKNYIKNELTTSDIWKECSAVKDGQIFFSPTGISPWGDIGVESVLMMDFALVNDQPIIRTNCNITMDDVKSQAKDFYREFSKVEMTDADIQNMLNNCDPNGASIDHPVDL